MALKNMHRKNIFVNLKKHNKPVILRNVGTLKTKSNDVCKKKNRKSKHFLLLTTCSQLFLRGLPLFLFGHELKL